MTILNVWGVLNLGFIIVVILILNEICQSYHRNYYRKYTYRTAAKRAVALNKPLIVIGDAHNGIGAKFHGPAYGSGSYVIDISGCSQNICRDVIERDIVVSLNAFEDNSCVVFVSCVLEYIPDCDIKSAIAEINRVAGSDDNIFIVTVGTASGVSYFYSFSNGGKHKDVPMRVFTKAPPYGKFEYANFSENGRGKKNMLGQNSFGS